MHQERNSIYATMCLTDLHFSYNMGCIYRDVKAAHLFVFRSQVCYTQTWCSLGYENLICSMSMTYTLSRTVSQTDLFLERYAACSTATLQT